ncbi:hypothetical protein [Geitlerinema calcuttense]|uniref:Uncharacterized protein n=1 Tax=Geitlerinema calcuttense NRMC-F 0142 TaxID=2922238 RepID=A0ABT7LXW5_9CYAN|nr:hypothetical protein [Geitlerinema calcuttense]MDL5056862.1 hypothetical protein [Geitlerinema calcuttense NRMC-F 0142]
MSRLIYPNLDLLVYQLREGFGDDEATLKANHQAFWQNLPEELRNPTPLANHADNLSASALSIADLSFHQEAEAPRLDYCELLPLANLSKSTYPFPEISQGIYPIQGYYYPVRIEDTYALLFDCYQNDPHGIVDIKTSFEALKTVANNKTGNLGKVWLLSGILPQDLTDDLQQLAQDSYNALDLGKGEVKPAGKFCGASCFEVWNYPRRWQSIDENIHVFIVFFPDLETAKNMADAYRYWLRLFAYRSKIMWAYLQTREIKRRLQDSYKIIFNLAKTLNQLNLVGYENSLQTLAETLSSYVQNLNYLEIQLNTLKVNLYNYQKTLKDLSEKFPETQLTELSHFIEIVKEKYQAQIESDIASLSPGLRVLEDLINSIRGKIEIQRAKSDRNLNYIIAGASIGLATSGVTATILSTQVYQPENTQNNRMPFTRGFLWSLSPIFFFVFIGAVAWYRKR